MSGCKKCITWRHLHKCKSWQPMLINEHTKHMIRDTVLLHGSKVPAEICIPVVAWTVHDPRKRCCTCPQCPEPEVHKCTRSQSPGSEVPKKSLCTNEFNPKNVCTKKFWQTASNPASLQACMENCETSNTCTQHMSMLLHLRNWKWILVQFTWRHKKDRQTDTVWKWIFCFVLSDLWKLWRDQRLDVTKHLIWCEDRDVMQLLHLKGDLAGELCAESHHDQEAVRLHVPHHLHAIMALNTLVTCKFVTLLWESWSPLLLVSTVSGTCFILKNTWSPLWANSGLFFKIENIRTTADPLDL